MQCCLMQCCVMELLCCVVQWKCCVVQWKKLCNVVEECCSREGGRGREEVDEVALLHLLAFNCTLVFTIVLPLHFASFQYLPSIFVNNFVTFRPPWDANWAPLNTFCMIVFSTAAIRTYALTFWTMCPGQAEVMSPRFAQGLRALSAFYFVHPPCAQCTLVCTNSVYHTSVPICASALVRQS